MKRTELCRERPPATLRTGGLHELLCRRASSVRRERPALVRISAIRRREPELARGSGNGVPVFGRPVTSPEAGGEARGEAGILYSEAERARSGRRWGEAKESEATAVLRRAETLFSL